jgi:rRNA maturation protein Nop10
MGDKRNPGEPARFIDLFNTPKVESSIAEARLAICKDCTSFTGLTNRCKECGCLMPLKVKLPHAFCPLNKWQAELTKENND